jgi:hypothetical protein
MTASAGCTELLLIRTEHRRSTVEERLAMSRAQLVAVPFVEKTQQHGVLVLLFVLEKTQSY